MPYALGDRRAVSRAWVVAAAIAACPTGRALAADPPVKASAEARAQA